MSSFCLYFLYQEIAALKEALASLQKTFDDQKEKNEKILKEKDGKCYAHDWANFSFLYFVTTILSEEIIRFI